MYGPGGDRSIGAAARRSRPSIHAEIFHVRCSIGEAGAAAAGRRGGLAGPGTTDHGRIHYAAISVKALLIDAYDVKDFQIEGPGWLDTERFAIDATMPPDTSKEQLRMMLQNLLAERFKLAIHRETKELPMYSLVVAKNGPKMKDSAEAAVPKDEEAPPRPPTGRGAGDIKFDANGFPNLSFPAGSTWILRVNGRLRIGAQQATMQSLANQLTSELSRAVVDETGLNGKYDFILNFSPEGLNGPVGPMGSQPPPPPGGGGRAEPTADTPEAREPLPNLFAAMQSELGLKLEPEKGPVERILIDHVEKTPTEN